jgi:hypothetical protein
VTLALVTQYCWHCINLQVRSETNGLPFKSKPIVLGDVEPFPCRFLTVRCIVKQIGFGAGLETSWQIRKKRSSLRKFQAAALLLAKMFFNGGHL